MSRWFRQLSAVPLVVSCVYATARDEPIEVVGADNFRPMLYLEAGQPKGKLINFLACIESKSSLRFHTTLMPWNRAFATSAAGSAAVIGLSMNPARRARFSFSQPIHRDEVNLVVLRSHAMTFTRIQDLYGQRLGVELGNYLPDDILAAQRNGKLQIDADSGRDERLRKLLAGRIDVAAMMNAREWMQDIVSHHTESHLSQRDFVVLEKPLYVDVQYFAIPKQMADHSRMIKQFNQAMTRGCAVH
ncbi:transporter substrate-binding domain-containing protein [Burkholderiaceae bacterium DAT-1]|nr:transporter substrate-binding domain-containing protein [Burkholderiaceae bacterium DAT-1]